MTTANERGAAEPIIVLVGPQLGENVGTAARAMLNCGLSELRLVKPRDGWPNRRAVAAATGAAAVVEQARVYTTSGEAVADLAHVYATSVRLRDMRKPTLGPRAAVVEMRAAAARGERSGILFGPERTGLSNDDISLAGKLIHIPLNPAFSSLNLAQAVLLLGYEWLESGRRVPRAVPSSSRRGRPASSAELQNFFAHLERELDAAGFLRVREKRAIMVRNLRNLFHRAELETDEVRTLHGVVTALCGRRRDGTLARVPTASDPDATKS